MSDSNMIPANTVAGLMIMNQGKPLTRITDHKEFAASVIARYMNGEEIKDIAAELGLKGPEQVYRLIQRHTEEEWKEAQTARAFTEYERAKALLESASDGLNLTRAREQAKLSQWELERLYRRLYGQEAPTNVNGNIQINIGISRD